MKTHLIILVLVVAVIVGAAYLLQPAPVVDSTKHTAATTASKISPSTAITPSRVPTTVAPPVVAPVAAPARASAAAGPAVTAPPSGSVQELCANLAAQLQNGDFSTVIDTYGDPTNTASMPPNLRQIFVESMNSPAASARVALWIRALQQLPDLTPVLSNDGETATYDVSSVSGTDPQSPISKLTLKKRDGKWYFTVTSLLIGGAGFGVGAPGQP